jgi:hypothetical protein
MPDEATTRIEALHPDDDQAFAAYAEVTTT